MKFFRILMVVALLGLLSAIFVAQGADGQDDVGVFRAPDRTWYYDYGHDGTTDAAIGPWGLEGDLPIAGDFDGDGVDDVAVFRPSNRTWYYDYSHNGTTDATVTPWAAEGDLPIAGDFEPTPGTEPSPGPAPGPVGGGIDLWVDRGCGPDGMPYNLGDPLIISYRVDEAGAAVLYDFDPYIGSYGRIMTHQLGMVLPGAEHRLMGRISAARGVETLVLRVTTASGRVLQDACSFSIAGVSTELARIWTDKGCGTEAVFHHRERATIYYSVDVPVTRARIYGINPRMGLVELTTVPLTERSGQIELTVGPQLGDAVLVAAAVTPTQGVITSSCWVLMD